MMHDMLLHNTDNSLVRFLISCPYSDLLLLLVNRKGIWHIEIHDEAILKFSLENLFWVPASLGDADKSRIIQK